MPSFGDSAFFASAATAARAKRMDSATDKPSALRSGLSDGGMSGAEARRRVERVATSRLLELGRRGRGAVERLVLCERVEETCGSPLLLGAGEVKMGLSEGGMSGADERRRVPRLEV
jgi:hypothetical protein